MKTTASGRWFGRCEWLTRNSRRTAELGCKASPFGTFDGPVDTGGRAVGIDWWMASDQAVLPLVVRCHPSLVVMTWG
jgi:hypothetical protein